MAFNADLAYRRSREDLLKYEDARFNSLVAAMANFYVSRNDNELFGAFLRSYAMEMGRLEYATAYDIVSKDPQYLTPADIKRRYSDVLFVSNGYPGTIQYDLDYKNMLVALLEAYRQGSTTTALEQIILAYTGQHITVQELYTLIGNGTGFDMTDHNSIRVSFNYGSGNTNDLQTNIVDLNQIQQITEHLYTAIDLDKPAHIGLNFTTVQTELLAMEDILNSITDFLRVFVRATEGGTWESVFTQSPFLDPTIPETELSAWGKRVGLAFPNDFGSILTTSQYNALPFASFKMEYQSIGSGNYGLIPTVYADVARVDPDTGDYTGEITKARGVLAPRIDTVWEAQEDTLQIYNLT